MTGVPRDEPVEEAVEIGDELKWPIGFITVLVLAGLYLMWRLIELGIRLFDWIS